MMETAIALLGYTGSGKTTTAKYLCSNKPEQFYLVTTGDITRNYLKKHAREITHESLQDATKELVSRYGDNYISLAFEGLQLDGKTVIIDAIRRQSDINYLNKIFKKLIVTFVDCSDENRFLRLKERKKSSDPITINQFTEMLQIEKAWGIPALISGSEYVIKNNGTVEDLYKNISSTFFLNA